MREGSRKLQLKVPLSSNEVSGCDLLTSFNHLIQMFTHGTQWPEFSLLSDDSKWLFPAYHWPINCKPREEKRKILCNNFWICHATPPPTPPSPKIPVSSHLRRSATTRRVWDNPLCTVPRFRMKTLTALHASGSTSTNEEGAAAEPPLSSAPAPPPPYYETLTWSQLRSALPGKVRGVHKGK